MKKKENPKTFLFFEEAQFFFLLNNKKNGIPPERIKPIAAKNSVISKYKNKKNTHP